MWLMLVFLAVPVIEVAIFIQVGGLIGLWPTLSMIVLSAVLGVILLRRQGARAMRVLRDSVAQRANLPAQLAGQAMILLAAVLLVIPGFATDLLGLLLLLPPVRMALYDRLQRRFHPLAAASAAKFRTHIPAEDAVIEGEFEEVPPHKQPTHQPSGWTRH